MKVPSGNKGVFKQFTKMYPNVNIHVSTYSQAISGNGGGYTSFDVINGTAINVAHKNTVRKMTFQKKEE